MSLTDQSSAAWDLHYVDDGCSAELLFHLEIASILQLDFDPETSLTIHSTRDLRPFVDRFNWAKIPYINKAISSASTLLDLGSVQKTNKLGVRSVITKKTEIALPYEEVFYFPQHLLEAPLKTREIQTSLAWKLASLIYQKKFLDRKDEINYFSLIYSEEVYEWLSLVEATELVIAFWYRHQELDYCLRLVNLSENFTAATFKEVLKSQLIVLAKISPVTAHFFGQFRALDNETPFVFHGFESSSVFFANTKIFKMEPLLQSKDTWLMSCHADKKLADISWENINSEVMPLARPHKHLRKDKKVIGPHLLYLGRISEQKNLHDIFYAIFILKNKMREEKRKFKIFGYEDFLGVPHLGIRSRGYGRYLRRLARQLKITDLIEFHPTISREEINDELNSGTFISVSTHSDENFGLVAFRALNLGYPVILSRWGGHLDLMESFPRGVLPIGANLSQNGVFINPLEVSQAILNLWKASPEVESTFVESSFRFSDNKGSEKLISTEIKKSLNLKFERIKSISLRKWPLYGVIFKSYKDVAFTIAAKTYGANSLELDLALPSFLSPFVRVNRSQILVQDVKSKRKKLCRFKADQANILVKQLGKRRQYKLTLAEWQWLCENGYILKKDAL